MGRREDDRRREIEHNIGLRFATAREDGIAATRNALRQIEGDWNARGLWGSGPMFVQMRDRFIETSRDVAQSYAEIMWEEYANARVFGATESDVQTMVEHLERFREGQQEELWQNYLARHFRKENEERRRRFRDECDREVHGAFAPAIRWIKANAGSRRLGRTRRFLHGAGKLAWDMIPKFGAGGG